MRHANEKIWILTLAPGNPYLRRSDSEILLMIDSEESAENVSEKFENSPVRHLRREQRLGGLPRLLRYNGVKRLPLRGLESPVRQALGAGC